jgi:hypothetical protein
MKYLDITKYFGTKLSDPDFQSFLKSISCDPTKYNVAKSEYVSSKTTGLEFGFRNDDAIYDEDDQKVFKKGTPIFSLFNIHPSSEKFIESIPFDIKFSDTKNIVREKAGQPIKIVDAESNFFKKRYMIDHFTIEHLAISVDYNSEKETIEFIQIRDNNQAKEHVKL